MLLLPARTGPLGSIYPSEVFLLAVRLWLMLYKCNLDTLRYKHLENPYTDMKISVVNGNFRYMATRAENIRS
jgi:hypothetical protein